MDSADALKELIARQAVEIERLQGHIKHIGNDALRSEVEKLRKDAARYDWFADIAVSGDFERAEKAFACFEFVESCTRQEIDAAIDAAIQKETP